MVRLTSRYVRRLLRDQNYISRPLVRLINHRVLPTAAARQHQRLGLGVFPGGLQLPLQLVERRLQIIFHIHSKFGAIPEHPPNPNFAEK